MSMPQRQPAATAPLCSSVQQYKIVPCLSLGCCAALAADLKECNSHLTNRTAVQNGRAGRGYAPAATHQEQALPAWSDRQHRPLQARCPTPAQLPPLLRADLAARDIASDHWDAGLLACMLYCCMALRDNHWLATGGTEPPGRVCPECARQREMRRLIAAAALSWRRTRPGRGPAAAPPSRTRPACPPASAVCPPARIGPPWPRSPTGPTCASKSITCY